MLEIVTIRDSIVTGGKLRVEARGGVEPYVFSLVSGGDGGTLVNGYYYSPFTTVLGYQIIEVEDDNGDTAQATIYVSDHLQLICEIIREYMGLDQDQVYAYNQKFTIPKDDRIYIAIGYQSINTIGNNKKFNDGVSEQYINNQAVLNVNIMSKSFSVMSRKEEVFLAMASDVADRVQLLNSFKISSVSTSISDVSGVDGELIPYRFSSIINIIYSKTKAEAVDYFDDFDNSVITNK